MRNVSSPGQFVGIIYLAWLPETCINTYVLRLHYLYEDDYRKKMAFKIRSLSCIMCINIIIPWEACLLILERTGDLSDPWVVGQLSSLDPLQLPFQRPRVPNIPLSLSQSCADLFLTSSHPRLHTGCWLGLRCTRGRLFSLFS